jgi:hypothetical protein
MYWILHKDSNDDSHDCTNNNSNNCTNNNTHDSAYTGANMSAKSYRNSMEGWCDVGIYNPMFIPL